MDSPRVTKFELGHLRFTTSSYRNFLSNLTVWDLFRPPTTKFCSNILRSYTLDHLDRIYIGFTFLSGLWGCTLNPPSPMGYILQIREKVGIKTSDIQTPANVGGMNPVTTLCEIFRRLG